MHLIQRYAVDIVSLVFDGRNLTEAFNDTVAAAGELTPGQRGAIRDISYGTLRYLSRLETAWHPWVTRSPSDPRIEVLLTIAIYQLSYTRAATYAIVDHAVKLAEAWLPSSKGMVNAVLRRFLRLDESERFAHCTTPALRFALPTWWQQRLEQDYPQTWEHIGAACLQHPPFCLRVNPAFADAKTYVATLAAKDAPAQVLNTQTVLINRAMPVQDLPGFMAGHVSVQDWGAQWAAPWLNLQNAHHVLDACAAPGGKTGHMLEWAAAQGITLNVLALDHDAARLARVNDNLRRLNLTARCEVGDAGKPKLWWDGTPFDRILLDAPCSASGVIRRHPDIKWHRSAQDITHFATTQRWMLREIWPTLAVGGELLYVTCSIFAEENDQVIADFLSRTPDAVSMPLPIADLPASAVYQATAHGVQLLPSAQHDGLFYARLAKR